MVVGVGLDCLRVLLDGVVEVLVLVGNVAGSLEGLGLGVDLGRDLHGLHSFGGFGL